MTYLHPYNSSSNFLFCLVYTITIFLLAGLQVQFLFFILLCLYDHYIPMQRCLCIRSMKGETTYYATETISLKSFKRFFKLFSPNSRTFHHDICSCRLPIDFKILAKSLVLLLIRFCPKHFRFWSKILYEKLYSQVLCRSQCSQENENL